MDCVRKSQDGDSVSVHYRGALDNGYEFDSSFSRGVPIDFKLGAGQVIRGWEIGILDMCIGEKRTLVIPPEYGYGARGIGPIPANAVLRMFNLFKLFITLLTFRLRCGIGRYSRRQGWDRGRRKDRAC